MLQAITLLESHYSFSLSIDVYSYMHDRVTPTTMRFSCACIFECFVGSTNTLTNPSMLNCANNCYNSALLVNHSSPVPSISCGDDTDDEWNTDTQFSGTTLYDAVVLLNAGHTLESIAVKSSDGPTPSEHSNVKNYDEVTISITLSLAQSTQQRAMKFLYQYLWTMQDDGQFESSRRPAQGS